MRVEPLKLTPVNVQAINDIQVPDIQAPQKSEGKTFGDFLSEAVTSVNDLQLKADKASIDLAAGKIDDVSQVVVATEKANVALQLTMQVRNKVVEAYQEIMRMQV